MNRQISVNVTLTVPAGFGDTIIIDFSKGVPEVQTYQRKLTKVNLNELVKGAEKIDKMMAAKRKKAGRKPKGLKRGKLTPIYTKKEIKNMSPAQIHDMFQNPMFKEDPLFKEELRIAPLNAPPLGKHTKKAKRMKRTKGFEHFTGRSKEVYKLVKKGFNTYDQVSKEAGCTGPEAASALKMLFDKHKVDRKKKQPRRKGQHRKYGYRIRRA